MCVCYGRLDPSERSRHLEEDRQRFQQQQEEEEEKGEEKEDRGLNGEGTDKERENINEGGDRKKNDPPSDPLGLWSGFR